MSLNYPTPHINAAPEDFAETVLMPGDPRRSEFIAKNYLTDAVLVNNVRGVQGYTGFYKAKKISVMASGMGMPSMGIYSYELFNFFGVKNIIRIGSAGAISSDIKLREIIMGMGACTNSNYAHQFALHGTFAPICDFGLLKACADTADRQGLSYKIGNILTSDTFYSGEINSAEWAKMGVMAVEMETAALYMNAAASAGRALAIYTVSDNIVTGEATSAEERESSFTQMIELALETAISI